MKKLTLLSLIVCSGCVMVPKTVIMGSIGGKPFSFSGPKDCTVQSIIISAETNGAVRLAITGLTTKMNPDVITTTGAAQAQLIDSAAKAGAAIVTAIPK